MSVVFIKFVFVVLIVWFNWILGSGTVSYLVCTMQTRTMFFNENSNE